MHVTSDLIKEVRAAAIAWLSDLETALTAHGFGVAVETKFWSVMVTAAAKLSPVRSQRVQLEADPSGRLDWYWARDTMADVDLLCPGSAIADATEHIARALTRQAADKRKQ